MRSHFSEAVAHNALLACTPLTMSSPNAAQTVAMNSSTFSAVTATASSTTTLAAGSASFVAAAVELIDSSMIEELDETLGHGAISTVQLGRFRLSQHQQLMTQTSQIAIGSNSKEATVTAQSAAAAAAAVNVVSPVSVTSAVYPVDEQEFSSIASSSSSSSHSFSSYPYVALKIAQKHARDDDDSTNAVSAFTPIRCLAHEQSFLSRLNHPGVARLLGFYSTPTTSVSIMPLYPYGTLGSHLRHHARRLLPASTVKQYMIELVSIVTYLHEQDIAHNDIKATNVSIDANGHLVLIDFDQAMRFSRKSSSPHDSTAAASPADLSPPRKGGGGTLCYYSPEKLQLYSAPSSCVTPSVVSSSSAASMAFASDWWTIGILLFEMIYGILPFNGETDEDLCASILAYNDILPERVFPPRVRIDPNVLDLLQGLLKKDWNQRLGTSVSRVPIHMHPYFAGVKWHNDVSSTATTPSFGEHFWRGASPAEFVRHVGCMRWYDEKDCVKNEDEADVEALNEL